MALSFVQSHSTPRGFAPVGIIPLDRVRLYAVVSSLRLVDATMDSDNPRLVKVDLAIICLLNPFCPTRVPTCKNILCLCLLSLVASMSLPRFQAAFRLRAGVDPVDIFISCPLSTCMQKHQHSISFRPSPQEKRQDLPKGVVPAE